MIRKNHDQIPEILHPFFETYAARSATTIKE